MWQFEDKITSKHIYYLGSEVLEVENLVSYCTHEQPIIIRKMPPIIDDRKS